jgi:hypothetical protein
MYAARRRRCRRGSRDQPFVFVVNHVALLWRLDWRGAASAGGGALAAPAANRPVSEESDRGGDNSAAAV